MPPTDVAAPAEAALEFTKADYESPPARSVLCTTCGATVLGEFFRAGDATLCARCASEHRAGRLPAHEGGFVRALVLGTLVALLGSLAYYAIRALTGYEFGLIGIALGFAVGAAVAHGCGGRGGKLYQLLAMALIYGAIVTTYVPDVLAALDEGGAATSVIEQAFRLVFAVAASFVLPFLAVADNVIGLIILGISMYEGWKLNARRVVQVDGPFPLAPASDGPAPSAAAA